MTAGRVSDPAGLLPSETAGSLMRSRGRVGMAVAMPGAAPREASPAPSSWA